VGFDAFAARFEPILARSAPFAEALLGPLAEALLGPVAEAWPGAESGPLPSATGAVSWGPGSPCVVGPPLAPRGSGGAVLTIGSASLAAFEIETRPCRTKAARAKTTGPWPLGAKAAGARPSRTKPARMRSARTHPVRPRAKRLLATRPPIRNRAFESRPLRCRTARVPTFGR
jgi:hypothetical protein